MKTALILIYKVLEQHLGQHGEIDIMEHGIFPSKPQDFIQVLFTHRHLLGIQSITEVF
jgi:hypothetical protein